MSDYCFVITGCTAGLGLALLERLISEYPSSHFIAICRNKPKAERVFKNLIERLKKTDGRLDVVVGDNGDLKTIQSAAAEIQKLTNQIDALYLNAGTMGNCRLDWKKILVAFCTLQFIRILVDATSFLEFSRDSTKDGYETRFQTNCFSHYLLVDALKPVLKNSSSVIWTSSATGIPSAFSFDDIQGNDAADPYGSSKWAVNLASAGVNKNLKVKSFICDPGTFQTAGITGKLISMWVFTLYSYFLCLLRPIVPNLTLTTQNATESLFNTFQNRETLKHELKYCSHAKLHGRAFVSAAEMKMNENDVNRFWGSLKTLQQIQFQKYKAEEDAAKKDAAKK